MTVNVSRWISLWPSFWPRALMGLNSAWKSKGAWTPLARSSVKIWSSGLIRTWDIKQQLFYGVNFCTEDFKRLSLLGSLFVKWFFFGRCSILLQRPIFTECEHFVPNLAMTLWRLELLHSLAQGTPAGCRGRAERVLLTRVGSTPRKWSWRTEKKGNVTEKMVLLPFPLINCTWPSPCSELLDPPFALPLC